jgi:hypothetical protein
MFFEKQLILLTETQIHCTEELSVNTNVTEANGKGVILLDKKCVGRNAEVIDAYDKNRPKKNPIFGSPYTEFPDIIKVVKDYGDQQSYCQIG